MEDESRDAVEALYRTQGERIWRAVMAYTQDPDLTSDAVAEAFAQAVSRGSAIRSPGSWVWRASFRIAASRRTRPAA
jgi:DNA-directed RNA polymerase specialized sigma24 family protein